MLRWGMPIVVIVLGFFVWQAWAKNGRAAALVENAPHAASNPPPRIFAGGVVEGARRELAVRSEIAGKIRAVHVGEGDSVRQGDVLAELEADEWELGLTEARAQLAIAVADRDRLTGQHPSRGVQFKQPSATGMKMAPAETAVSREEITIAEARVTLAQAAVQRATLNLGRTSLRSPVSGIVLRVLVEPGESVRPVDEQELFTVVDRASTRVRAFVEELDAMSVTTGQNAAITAVGRPDRTYLGTVSHCAPSMHPKSHRHLKPGERIDVQVREVLIDLKDGNDLLIGLPVEVFLQAVEPETDRE